MTQKIASPASRKVSSPKPPDNDLDLGVIGVSSMQYQSARDRQKTISKDKQGSASRKGNGSKSPTKDERRPLQIEIQCQGSQPELKQGKTEKNRLNDTAADIYSDQRGEDFRISVRDAFLVN